MHEGMQFTTVQGIMIGSVIARGAEIGLSETLREKMPWVYNSASEVL